MAEVMVINPRRRRGRRKKSTHRRAARSTRRRRVRRAVANPVRRRRRSGKRRVHARRRRHVSRNPRFGLGGGTKVLGVNLAQASGVAIGMIGASLAAAAVLNNVPGIPANFKTGPAKIAAKAVIGVGAGLAVNKLLKQKNLGNGIAAGAAILALWELYQLYAVPHLPTNLQDYELTGGVSEYQLGDGGGDDNFVEEGITGFSGAENMYTDTMY